MPPIVARLGRRRRSAPTSPNVPVDHFSRADAGHFWRAAKPFFAILKEERQKNQPVSASDAKWLAGLTVQLVASIRAEVGHVGFWKNAYAQDVLRGAVFTFLYDHEIVPFEKADAVADRLLELAKANHSKLAKA